MSEMASLARTSRWMKALGLASLLLPFHFISRCGIPQSVGVISGIAEDEEGGGRRMEWRGMRVRASR